MACHLNQFCFDLPDVLAGLCFLFPCLPITGLRFAWLGELDPMFVSSSRGLNNSRHKRAVFTDVSEARWWIGECASQA
jgi:hypothetical protein